MALDPHAESDSSSLHMQCMEIWGGNQVVDTNVVMPGLDAWVYSKPYGEADGGGDVHYVSSCATGRITRLLVADVSGHGAAVCDTAGTLRTLMRQFVNYLDQSQFVRAMNRKFTELSASSCFATAVVTTFFAPTNHLSLCNAGHPPPLIYRRRTGEWTYLESEPEGAAQRDDPSNIPLGILDLTDYDQFEVDLDVGDLVLCYTDSLVEAKDANGEYLGQDGLLRVVRSLDVSDPAKLTAALLNAISAGAPGTLDADDVTVLLFRPNGSAPTPPLRDRLLAPLRIVRAAVERLAGKPDPVPWPEFSLPNIGGALLPALGRRWHGRKI